MVFQAGYQAKAKYGLHTLVIVADQDSAAARLYESVGFQPTEKQVGLEWWPEMEGHADEAGQTNAIERKLDIKTVSASIGNGWLLCFCPGCSARGRNFCSAAPSG
jgi:hypothetical protein